MDLALVLDGSDSVGNADFEKLKNWSKSFIENLQVDKYGAKVGVIKYATSIKDVSPMSSDIEDIKRRIDRVSWIQGYTNTGAALERVRTKLFAEGGRENVPKVIVVVTDGESTDTEKLMSEAATLKEQGILIYMVGVGEQIKQSELNAVATGKEFVYETRNYDSINQIKNSLLGRVCKEADEKSTGDCGDIAVDLQFIIDASSSVKAKNFIHSQNFAKNISNTFDLRHGDVRVGVLTYSSTVHDHQDIELGDPIDGADDLNARIDAMPYEHGDTHTGAALRFIETNARWREEVPKILIFITDGRPQDRGQVPAAAQSLRDKGVRIFAIGVGDATEAELKEIASTPYEDHVIFISGADYSAVGQLRGYLENIVCREVEAIDGGAQIADLDQGILTIRPAQPAKKEPDTQRFQNPATGQPGSRNNAAGRYGNNVVEQSYRPSQASSHDTSRVAPPRVSTPDSIFKFFIRQS
jgi:collagen type VI alpha